MIMKCPKQRKIAIMGYRAVGKSSLSMQYVGGEFCDSYDPTIENTFFKETTLDNQEYEVKLVDTAGQDEYSILTTHYSMDIHGYILVYSITMPKSFEIIRVIYDKLLDLTGKMRIPVVVVGNKIDLNSHRLISAQEGYKLAGIWKSPFLEASAKTNKVFSKDDISNIFSTMLKEIERSNDRQLQDGMRCQIL